MAKDSKYIEKLLERFFNGETSNEEEKVLYKFFSGKEVPESLQQYKAVFGYFKSGIAHEVGGKKNSSRLFLKQSKKKLRVIGFSVAALLLLVLSLRLGFLARTSDTDWLEGSYIIRNGVKITNLEKIRPELEHTLVTALLQQEKAEQMMKLLDDPESAFRDVEQEIKEQQCEILNQFTDEYVREEVKSILDIDCEHL